MHEIRVAAVHGRDILDAEDNFKLDNTIIIDEMGSYRINVNEIEMLRAVQRLQKAMNLPDCPTV